MKAYKIILLVVGLIILIFIFYWINKLISKNSGNSIRPEFCNTPDCIGKSANCNIMNPKTLTSCTVGEDQPCLSCYGDMECQSITSAKKYPVDIKNLPGGKCEHPYVLEDSSDPYSQCFLPTGDYCVPFNIPDIQCNEFTGRKVLGKVSEHANYEWLCACVDDTQFTNDGNPLSDCNHIRACGMNGSTNDNPTSIRHLLDETGSIWSSTGPYNPFKGTCQCGPNEVEGKLPLTCVANQCFPGSPCTWAGCDPAVSCECQKPLIDCHTVANRGGFNNGECPEPSCVPDPCFPGIYNPALHNGNGGCDCSFDKNYVAVPVPNSITGEMCINWCNTSKNPCGDRGDCIVNTDTSNDPTMSFLFTYISQGDHANTWVIQNGTDPNSYYWALNNNNITLQKGGTLTFFHIEGDCDKDPCKLLDTIKGGSKYYLRTADDSQYISMTSKGDFTSVSSKSKANYWMFVQDYDPKTGTAIPHQGRILIDSTFYIKVFNTPSPHLTIGISTLNIPTCVNCKVPNSQGPNNTCENKCIENGKYLTVNGVDPVGSKGNCCSCNIDCSSPCFYCDNHTPGCKNMCSGDGGNIGEISKYSSVAGCS